MPPAGVSIIHGAENVLSVFGFCYQNKSPKFKSKVRWWGFQIRGDFIKVKFTAAGTKLGGECVSS